MTVSTWRKSSYSGQTGDCVEVIGTLKWVRDSKDPEGKRVALSQGFIAAVKTGWANTSAD